MKAEIDRLRELLAIARTITGSVAYDAIPELVVEKARELTGADACALLLAAPGAEATIVASAGVPRDAKESFRAVLDERIAAVLSERLGLGGKESILAVPMIVRGDLRGILAVARRGGAMRAEDHEEILSALADQAAIALGNAAHLRELERALAEAERERRAREEVMRALRAEQTWLHAVIAHAPIAIILVEGLTPDHVTANAAAEELLGRSIAPNAGLVQYAAQLRTTDGASLPPDELPSIAATRGETVHRELVIQRPDGSVAPVLVSASAIRANGDVLGAIVFFQNISILKDLERIRQEWTTMIAHDLLQPVQAIAFRAQLLSRQGAEIGDVPRFAEIILASARRLDRMIHDLLDVSLIEARHLSIKRTRREVGAMLRDIVDRCAWMMTQGGWIELVVDPDVPSVDVDGDRIVQVVANLLKNAVTYGSPDNPIEIRTSRGADAVEIVVSNSGAGITPADIGKLFNRFQRGNETRTKPGLGVGLYICKGIIEAHGGRIWAESAPGRTAFHFTLPVAT